MKKNKLQRPSSLFYFRGNIDVILFLLQRELKGGKVSQLCAPLGINTEFFYPNLGTLILSLMDLPYRSESLMNWYEKNCISGLPKLIWRTTVIWPKSR